LGHAHGTELRRADVGHDARQVADLAVGVEQAGLFLAGVAKAKQLHVLVAFLVGGFNTSRGRPTGRTPRPWKTNSLPCTASRRATRFLPACRSGPSGSWRA